MGKICLGEKKNVWGEGIIWGEIKGVEKPKKIVLVLWNCDCPIIVNMWNPGAEG